MLTIRQLKAARYIVIAAFPGGPKVGSVIKGTVYKQWHDMHCVEVFKCEKYPAVFRRLRWAEFRHLEDMPKYVKFTADFMDFVKGSVYQVEDWANNFKEGYIPIRKAPGKYNLAGIPENYNVLEPATEKEYKAQFTSKRKVTNAAKKAGK